MKSKRLCLAIIIILLAFIWGNSMLPKNASSNLSIWAMGILSKVFSGDIVAEETVAGAGILRKVAHFTEFCALGIALSALLHLIVKDKRIRALLAALFGGFVALFDETIQIFSGRGPMVSDIWIDIAGFATGVVIVVLIVAVKRKIKMKSKSSDGKET